MDKPLCKICGERHNLGYCPKHEVRDIRRLMKKAEIKKPKRKAKKKGRAA